MIYLLATHTLLWFLMGDPRRSIRSRQIFRLLIAQSLTEKLPLLSVDSVFDLYGINRLY